MRPDLILDTRRPAAPYPNIISPKRIIRAPLLALTLLALFSASNIAHAAAVNWVGGTGAQSWNTTTNWSTNALPTINDDVTIAVGANLTLTLGANQFAKSITISPTAGTVTISAGSTLAVGSGGINVTAGTNTQISCLVTIDSPNTSITVGSGLTFIITGVISGTGGIAKQGTGILRLSGTNSTFAGAIDVQIGTLQVGIAGALGTAAGATTVASGATLDLNGVTIAIAEPVTLSGTGVGGNGALINSSATNLPSCAILTTLAANATIGVSNGTITLTGTLSGSAKLTKVGANVLVLSANNNPSFTGSIDISAGTLRLGNTDALGTPVNGTTVLATGAALDLNGFSIAAEPILINGTGTSGTTGAITNISATAASINSSVTLQTASAIGGANGIILNGQMSGAALNKVGAGALQINSDNSTYSAGVTLTLGTLQFGHDQAIGMTGSLSVAGASTIEASGGARTIPNNVTLGANLTIGANSSDITLAGDIDLGAATRTVTTSNTGTNIFSGVISGTASAGLTKTGTGSLKLAGTNANTYPGPTTITTGTLIVAKNLALGAATTGVNGTLINSGTILGFEGGINYSAAEEIQMNNGTDPILRNISGNNTFGGTITLNDTTLNIFDIVSGTFTHTGIITSAAAKPIAKNGSGTLELQGNNTVNMTSYTINAGSIKLSGASGAISATTITIFGLLELDNTVNANGNRIANTTAIANQGGTLLLNGAPTGGVETVGAMSFPANGCTVRINAYGTGADATLTSTSSTFSVTGDFNFERNSNPGGSTAFLKLTGGAAGPVANAKVNLLPNTYDTTNGLIEDLTSVIVSAQDGDWDTAATWSPATVPDSGANVYIKHQITKNLSTTRTVASITLTTGVSATPSLTGSNSINVGNGASGSLNAGAVFASVSTPINLGGFQGVINVASGGTLNVTGGMTSTAGGINKTGAGTANFSGTANSYVGTTTITAGTLGIDNDNKLGTAAGGVTLNGGILSAISDITLPITRIVTLSTNGGTLDVAATKTFTLNSALTGNFAFTKSGSGTLVLSQASIRNSGATTISAGIVHVDAAAGFGTTAIPVISVVGTLEIGNGVTFPNNISLTNGSTLQGVGTSTIAGSAGIVNLPASARASIFAPGSNDVFNLGSVAATNTIVTGAGATAVFGGLGRIVMKTQNNFTSGATEIGSGAAQAEDTEVQIDSDLAFSSTTGLTIKTGGRLIHNAGFAPNLIMNLSGGLIAATGASRQLDGTITAVAGTTSTILLCDAYNNNTARDITLNFSGGKVSGSGTFNVNPGVASGTLVLRSTSTDFQGVLSINSNANSSATVQAVSTGALGTSTNRATVQMNGGTLQLRSATAADFNANIQVTQNSTINVDRPGIAGANFTLTLNSLNVPTGLSSTPTLTVTNDPAISRYLLSFISSGTLNGNVAINPQTATTAPTYLPVIIGAPLGGSGSLTQSGPGRLEFYAANTFTGGLVVNGTTALMSNSSINCDATVNSTGTLLIDDTASTTFPNRIPDTATVTLDGGIFQIQAKANNPRIENIGTLALTSGESTVYLLAANGADTQLIAATSSRSLGSLLKFNRGISPDLLSTPNLVLQDISFGQTSGPDLLLPWASVYDNGTLVNVAVYKKYPVEDGVIPLSAASTYITAQDGNWNSTTTWVGGVVPPNDGNVTIRHGVALADNAGPQNITINSVTFDQSGGSISGAATVALTVSSGSVLVATGVAATINANLSFLNTEPFLSVLTSGQLNFNGVVTGSQGLTKLGAGTLVLGAANTYTGATTLFAGTLTLGNDNSISTGALTVYSGTTIIPQGGTRSIANSVTLKGSVTFGGTSDIVFSGPVTVDQSSNIRVDNPSATFTGNIGNGSAGSLALTKNGAGALRLSGTNTFSGGLTLNEGALHLGSNSALGTGGLTIGGAGTSVEAFGLPRTISNALAVNNDFSVTGNIDLSFTGNIVINFGTRLITFNNAGTTAFDGVVSGQRITKRGSGTLKLSNTNTFSGISHNEGKLQVASNAALGSGTMRIQGAAVLEAVGTAPRTVTNALDIDYDFTFVGSVDMAFNGTTTLSGNRIVTVSTSTAILAFSTVTDSINSYSLTKAGTGTLTLTGNSTFDLAIADGGILNLKGDTATLGGGVTVNPSGTFTIDSQGTANVNRILDTSAGVVTLNGGYFKLTAPASADRTETVNKLVLKAGTSSTIELVTLNTASTPGDAQFTATTYTREAGASLKFIRTKQTNGPVPNLFLSSIVQDTGLPWATIDVANSRAKYDYDASPVLIQGVIPAVEGDAWISKAVGNWNNTNTWTKPTTYTDTDNYPGETNLGAEVIIRHAVTITHATAPAPQKISTVSFDDTVGAGTLSSSNTVALQILGGGVYVVDKQPGTAFTHQINCNISFPDAAGPTAIEGLFQQGSSGATADTLDVIGAIDNASHGGVAVNGVGLVKFSNATGNTFTGQTGIYGGKLSISNDNHLGAAAASNPLVLSGGTLQVRGASNSLTLNSSRAVSIGAGGGSFEVLGTNTLTIPVGISGSGIPNGSLNSTGAGTLILNVASTRVGAVAISGGGVVKLNNANSLGASGTTVSLTGGTLWLNAISLNMPIALNNGAGLQGTGICESIGTMTVASNAQVTVVSDPSAIFTLGYDPNAIVGGGGTAKITVNGTGRVILADNNTYTGQWERNNGLLQVNTASSLGTATNLVTVIGGSLGNRAISPLANPITLNNSTLAPMNGSRTFTGAISVVGASASTISLFDAVNGTADWNMTLTGALTGTTAPLLVNSVAAAASSRELTLTGSGSGFTQPVTVNSGVLSLQNSGSLGGNITMQSGTVLELDDTGSAAAVDRLGNSATVSLNGAKLNFTANANTTHDEVFGALNFAGNCTVTMTPNSSATGLGDLQIHVSSSNLASLVTNVDSLKFYRNTSGSETANLFITGFSAGPVSNTQVFEALGPGPGKYDTLEGLRSTNLTNHTTLYDGNWRGTNNFKWTGGGAVTVAFWVKVNTGQVQNSFAFGVGTGGGGGNRFSAHCPWSDGNIYWDYGNIGGAGRLVAPFGPLDVWKHIALVSSGTANTFKGIYINGTLQTPTGGSASTSGGPTGTLSNLFIGASPESAASNFQKGLIDDFRIYNRMLTQPEIATLAASGSVAAPIGYWTFDEASGNALDSSGNGYTGFLLNGATRAAGQIGSALSLDGANDYVAVPDSIWNTGVLFPPVTEQATINGHAVNLLSSNESITNLIFAKPGSIAGTGRTLTIDTLGVLQINTSNSGLKADYYQNNTLTGSPALTRFDPNVDYNIGVASWPIPLLNTNFSVHWTGFVTPLYTETYTFYVSSDDGARLIVNGVTLFDRFPVGQGETETGQTATIDLVAGVPVPIVLDYQQGGGGAACHLKWSSASTPKNVIPQSALSAPAGYIPPLSTISVDTLQFQPIAPNVATGTGFINFSNNGSLVISSVITGTYATGDGLKFTANSGDVTLSGTNTYTGFTTLSTGTIYIGNTAAFGGSTLIIESGGLGATASLSSFVSTLITAKGNFSLIGTNAFDLRGNVTLTGSRTITVSNSATGGVTLSGIITDGGGIL